MFFFYQIGKIADNMMWDLFFVSLYEIIDKLNIL
jgi:hypothetical protein